MHSERTQAPAEPDTAPETEAGGGGAGLAVTRLEQRLATLEGGDDCVATASGMAAISNTCLALLSAGDHVVASRVVYVSVNELLRNHLPGRFGINSSLVETWDLQAVRKAITPQTRMVYVETPANPTTQISDIAAIARIAREAEAILTVDSTLSGLITQHPLQLGADLVIHSITKYANGHADALGGAVIGRRPLIERIRQFAVVDFGAGISPFNAWQILRGLVTLPMRMERHNRNALLVAQFLEGHPKVAWVRYPGLQSHPQHEIARKQMSGFSGMLNFDIKGRPRQRAEVLKRLKLFTHASCFGHDQSLIAVYRCGRRFFFRVSVGLEDPQDLIADLDQALRAVE